VRRVLLALLASVALAAIVPASVFAGQGNPSETGTGLPGQSCEVVFEEEGHAPGKSAGSPGSPFNEPIGGSEGGTGGQHYNETSQYDVACYHVSH
jgi:hypothetical protein